MDLYAAASSCKASDAATVSSEWSRGGGELGWEEEERETWIEDEDRREEEVDEDEEEVDEWWEEGDEEGTEFEAGGGEEGCKGGWLVESVGES